MDEVGSNYTKIMDYIDRNPAAVLGTIGEDGPHGAVVYVIPASHGAVCFVTKNQTQKYANLIKEPSVSLTFFNEKEGTTLQASGKAYVASDDQRVRGIIMDKLSKSHSIMSSWLPPVAQILNGKYAVIGVELKSARLADYGGISISERSFTEL